MQRVGQFDACYCICVKLGDMHAFSTLPIAVTATETLRQDVDTALALQKILNLHGVCE